MRAESLEHWPVAVWLEPPSEKILALSNFLPDFSQKLIEIVEKSSLKKSPLPYVISTKF